MALSRKHKIGAGLTTLVVAPLTLIASLGVAGAAEAPESTAVVGQRVEPTEEQRTCLEDAGIQRPQGRPTAEDREAFRTAAEACGIELPAPGEFGPGPRHGPRPELTDEQQQCLTDAGLVKPEERPSEPPTVEQRDAFRVAAEACGIEMPAPGRFGRHGPRPELTDEQRTCLEDSGLERPAGPPTAEARDAFRAAAEACGIDLPDHPAGSPAWAPPASGAGS